MKKAIPAGFAALIAAVVLIAALAGCDYELVLTGGTGEASIPWLTSVPAISAGAETGPTTLPEILPTLPPIQSETAPAFTQIPETTTEEIVTEIPPNMFRFDPSRCMENADERAAAQGWVCLNEYIDGGLYSPLFDTKSGASEGVEEFSVDNLIFDRPVDIYGIELTFAQPELEGFAFTYDDLDVDWFSIRFSQGVEVTEDDRLLLSGNTLWLEIADGRPLSGSAGLSAYARPDNLVRIRFFGTASPIIEEVYAPSYLPKDMTVREYRTATQYAIAYYSNSTGVMTALFEQSVIYGSQKLPAGDMELIQFAGREVLRIRYGDSQGSTDLYWNDGRYRYNLYGTDDELLLRLAESIRPVNDPE